ncbi:HTH-type transcriptional regulator [Pseudovibrio sp. W64]|uniref:ArsR/SmtB family transcription factor n=1 Tax=unclassified Pseudovibrio TaxID=2627060 RepID=UPI0007AEACE8|nr:MULTISPECIES: metalloregulator ArsR/SmtB family transcription factor [unclassified Pseudovibrio]KZK81722.1 HTH-type transcriptional regulator [Pseudovibrio sp. W64]KZK83540.1 HTH-type transcriptional regulator [Pseudovibrio sp. Ad13]KZL06054.1 HTH-type transcriptional regulator [Pseudovibrio sp. Ad26]KZL18486.1 HTH-type transcriptional regulator [Pseudovibrio sp. WM33]KZL25047.1 HTH-type transcriptional regulator [Pseudovibrio sp. Ad37]
MTYQDILHALADDTRRKIFEDLRAGPKNVKALSQAKGVTRPAVSQHLKVLERAGLVEADQRGTSRFYAVRREGISPLRDYLDQFWEDVLNAFATEVTEQQEMGHDHTSGEND